jgi:hypothetical protein
MRAQDQFVPMRRDLVIGPEIPGDRFVAHLLGNRDAVFLHLAVGVIGAGADPEATAMLQQYEFRLPARRIAKRFDGIIRCHPHGGGPIKDRCRRRALNTDGFELSDVLLDGRFVASGPAGNHKMFDLNRTAGRPRFIAKNKRNNSRRHGTSTKYPTRKRAKTARVAMHLQCHRTHCTSRALYYMGRKP